MNATASSSPTAFESYLSQRLEEPAVRAGFEDEGLLQKVIDRLVGFRKALNLTQTDVAKRMGVKQPTVSGFETEMSDPRLSTLQRYARAVEARVEIKITWDAECDWVSESGPDYEVDRVEAPRVVRPRKRHDMASWPQTPYTLAA